MILGIVVRTLVGIPYGPVRSTLSPWRAADGSVAGRLVELEPGRVVRFLHSCHVELGRGRRNGEYPTPHRTMSA
jgi:hypothetical protein